MAGAGARAPTPCLPRPRAAQRRLPVHQNNHRESLKNVKFIQTLLDVIGEAGADGGCPRTQGNLLYVVAVKVRCVVWGRVWVFCVCEGG